MDLGLAGKKALITGATKGIGRTVAETLLAEGASVAICARNAEGVEKALEEMSALGTVVGSAVDAGDGEAVAAWVASSAEQLGGIDIYVHNTSGKGAKTPEGWMDNFNIDMMSLVLGVGAAQEALAPRPRPSTSLQAQTATAHSSRLSPTGPSARPKCWANKAFAATLCRLAQSSSRAATGT